MADLKSVVERIHAAGLKAGLHLHYSKATKQDAYVTPVPDDRLHKMRHFTLTAAVDEKSNTITVNEDPAGCTKDDQRRILQVGKELIYYNDYTVQGPVPIQRLRAWSFEDGGGRARGGRGDRPIGCR